MPLQRTPITWAIYGVNGAWASFIYLSGPIAPILAEDLGVSVGAAGLVGTALAAGIATASVTGPAAIARIGRDRTTRVGLLVVAVTLAAITLVPTVLAGALAFGVILALIWVGSTGGGTVLNASTARLSDRHPVHSGQAITEANAVAAWVGLFSPLLLGAALGVGLGWWVGILVCLVAALAALAGLVLAGRIEGSAAFAGSDGRASAESDRPALVAADEGYVPPAEDVAPAEAVEPAEPSSARLPKVFWVGMVALFAAVATEFAINFWGSPLIQEQTGADTATATAAMSTVVAGIAVGRTIGSWLTARLGAHAMLLGGFGLALVGFAILWSAQVLALSIVGLVVVGLGLATLFPLLLDRGIQLSGGHPDQALARSSLIMGLAIGGAPFILGALGSVVSVATALLLVPVLILAGLIGTALSKPPVLAGAASA
ncbi:MAG: MFS transporter [Candidatus Nanopelagicales bacterium]